MTNFVEVDVRPTLRAGGEPFGSAFLLLSGTALFAMALGPIAAAAALRLQAE